MTEKSTQAKTVMIVDDDDLLREFYSRVLRSKGFEVVSATNGEEAMDMLKTQRRKISLVIADLLMPVRTGWELIEFMKRNHELKEIPVIAITGLAASLDEFEQVKATCDAVLHKGDFDLAKFTDTIAKLTG